MYSRCCELKFNGGYEIFFIYVSINLYILKLILIFPDHTLTHNHNHTFKKELKEFYEKNLCFLRLKPG